jgi:uncharacterized DUF497 family protein
MAVQPSYLGIVDLGLAGFEWDQGNRDKCQKHGVPLAAIENVFEGPLVVFPDSAHSRVEERLKAIGVTGGGRGVLVVFTLRKRDRDTLIRVLSARYMHRKEMAHYEREVKKNAEAEKR